MRLSLDQVSVTFGSVVALADVSLTVPDGTHLLVWGAAGSGKTTLLKLFAGLAHPSVGTAKWNDDDIARLSAADRRAKQAALGMVFQSDALFDSQTVLENVRFPLLRRGVADVEADRRARKTLEQVGLSHALEKRPEVLSGGMRKRVGVARAIVAEPQVLLADDPFAGLDPKTEKSIAELLVEVSRGRTLVVAVPDPPGSLEIDRQLELRAGKVFE